MKRPDLSVALVNWNALALTSGALFSIKEHTQGIDYEVFVVDNGTTQDDSRTELPVQFPWINLIVNSANQGFTKANNQAIRRAVGRYVLLLNNDTVQLGNALGESVRYMDTHPEIGALGILHLNNDPENTLQPSYFAFPKPWLEALALIGIRDHTSHSNPIADTPREADVDWICGSFLMMRRECLEEVGSLDERFFIYDEDIDWCRRAHLVGWKVRFWSGASMIHIGSAAKPFMKDKTFIHFRSHLSYLRKHHGFLAATSYYLAMGMRLTRATVWQMFRLMLGKGRMVDLNERFRRQVLFLTLRSGQVGG